MNYMIEILHNMENEDLSMETVLTLSNIKDKRIAEAYKELIPKYIFFMTAIKSAVSPL